MTHFPSLRMLAIAAALGSCSLAQAAPVDGPYVLHGGAEAWWVDAASDGATKRVEVLKPGATVTIPAVGDLPAFEVRLRPAAKDDPDTIDTGGKAPLFIVADTHGEFEIFVHELVKQRVVDAKLHWNFGRGHLVLLGDVFDRGANQLEILWLLYALEAEARTAHGGVHLLLGNHETMMIRGDLRYLNAKYVASATTLAVGSYPELFAADSVLGQWLRTKPAMLSIDGNLCLHGGVSPELLDRKLTLGEINAGIRAVLAGAAPTEPVSAERLDFLMRNDGPLWYRGYFDGQQGYMRISDADVDRTLAAFGARRILVGHTRVPTITPLFGGKVIAVQVYPTHEPGGPDRFEALSIEQGKLFRALPGGERVALEIP